MFRNYFKIAWRNLMKHKLFSFINIFGLASAMTVCMISLIKIKEAFDYDQFHPRSDLTYRITTNFTRHKGDQAMLLASSPLALGQYLKSNYGLIDKITRVHFHPGEITANYKTLFAKGAFADEDFYNIFGFHLASGYPAIAPQTIVLSEEKAKLFFGYADPVGQTITIADIDFVVTGVLEKPPLPTHLRFDYLAPMSSISMVEKSQILLDWNDEAAGYTYIQMKKGATSENLKLMLSEVSKKANTLFLSSGGPQYQFGVQSLNHISPSTKPIYNITDEPTLPNLLGLGSIALVMLLLAFFNYVNLTLARSLDRAREVGIRKVVGALKFQLTLQFLAESLLVASLAFCLAQVLLKLISRQPTIQRLIADTPQDGKLWLYFLVFTVVTGLIAGWIPSRVFSSFQPVRVLRGRFNTKLFGTVGLRKTLMVAQFTISLVAIVTLLVFYHQSMYMATADYGFARERMLNIPVQGQTAGRLMTSFSQISGVENVAAASEMFGFSGGDHRLIRRYKAGDSINSVFFSITPSLLTNMGIALVAGNNLPPVAAASGRQEIIINEEASRQLQFKNPYDAVGQLVWLNDSTAYHVTGVAKDFHFASFLRSIQPLILTNQPEQFKILNVKVAKGSERTIAAKLEGAWKKVNPHQPFEARWFDKQLYEQHLHSDDLVFIAILTGMALSIACLGLLGMVIYTAKNRSKEVSIRRVMGANIWQVILVMSKNFIWLLLLAVAIGLPLGLFTGEQILQQYAYRISIGAGILTTAAIALLMVGGLTIIWQTYRTAVSNPAKSLRIE